MKGLIPIVLAMEPFPVVVDIRGKRPVNEFPKLMKQGHYLTINGLGMGGEGRRCHELQM